MDERDGLRADLKAARVQIEELRRHEAAIHKAVDRALRSERFDLVAVVARLSSDAYAAGKTDVAEAMAALALEIDSRNSAG